MRAIPLIDRFWNKVDKCGSWSEVLQSHCWVWTAGKNSHGYGYISECRNGIKRSFGAHRVSYELLVGPIRIGKQLDHLCRNRACVNPEHLEQVTIKENLHRSPIAPAAKNKRKQKCPRGHDLNEQNTYINPKKSRVCRTCARIEALSRYHRTKVLKRTHKKNG